MRTLPQDVRYALRAFARNPGFTAAALLSLAIGMGADASVFSVANALLLRPLPYPDAERLVILWNRSPGLGITQDWFSTAQYLDIKTGHHAFEQIALAIGGTYNLTGDGEPERIGAVRVSSNLFSMLGARAVAGRLFLAEEDSPGRATTVVLTHGMWTRRYGADPRMVGKSILINGQPREVVGILPPAFVLPRETLPTLYGADQADIFLPLPLAPDAAQIRTHEDYNIVGKLKRGVSLASARAEMDTLTARLRRDFPEVYPPNGGLTFGVVPLLEQVVGDVHRMLLLLMGAVGLVLLIACANVANLLLSRAMARQQEIGVRAALGAGRGRIVRQLLTESILLALGGGALGALFAVWSVKWIHTLGMRSVPRLQEIGIDARVLGFTLLLSILSGALFGLAPAWRVSRLDLASVLKQASRGAAGMGSVWARGNYARRLIVVAELALSMMLLVAAGLLIRSFLRLQQTPPGFNPQNVLTFDLAMTGRKYGDPQAVLGAWREVWERLERLPGATAAGGTTSIPMSDAFAWTPITIEGRAPAAGEKFINADSRVVGGRYFHAMGIPLRRGRFFDEHDDASRPRVVIVDERMAQEFWPGQDPVGKRIHIVQLRSTDPWQTIVGVVGRVKQDSLDSDPRIAFYLPQNQSPSRSMTVALRAASDPVTLAAAVRGQIRALDPDLPMYGVRAMQDRVAESLSRRRFFEWMLTLFAGLAFALAAVGIYGVMACLVSQGTREIGIRMAMGATQQAILRLVVRQGMTLAGCGLAIGLAGALLLGRIMRSLLFGITTTDGLTFGAASLLLAFVALAASYVPARKAARVDPIASLRND